MTELVELRKRYQEILERGVEVVAISVDPPEVSERLRRRLDLSMRFLSDEEGILLDRLAIRHHNGRPPAAIMPPGHRERTDDRDIFLPVTFLVDVPAEDDVRPTVRWVYRPETYRVRATPDTVIAAIDGGRDGR